MKKSMIYAALIALTLPLTGYSMTSSLSDSLAFSIPENPFLLVKDLPQPGYRLVSRHLTMSAEMFSEDFFEGDDYAPQEIARFYYDSKGRLEDVHYVSNNASNPNSVIYEPADDGYRYDQSGKGFVAHTNYWGQSGNEWFTFDSFMRMTSLYGEDETGKPLYDLEFRFDAPAPCGPSVQRSFNKGSNSEVGSETRYYQMGRLKRLVIKGQSLERECEFALDAKGLATEGQCQETVNGSQIRYHLVNAFDAAGNIISSKTFLEGKTEPSMTAEYAYEKASGSVQPGIARELGFRCLE